MKLHFCIIYTTDKDTDVKIKQLLVGKKIKSFKIRKDKIPYTYNLLNQAIQEHLEYQNNWRRI